MQTVHLIILEHARTRTYALLQRYGAYGSRQAAGFQQITPTLGTAHPPSWGVMPTEKGKAWARERS